MTTAYDRSTVFYSTGVVNLIESDTLFDMDFNAFPLAYDSALWAGEYTMYLHFKDIFGYDYSVSQVITINPKCSDVNIWTLSTTKAFLID